MRAFPVTLAVLCLGHAPGVKPRSVLDYLVPAPPHYSIVYDNPANAGGIDPATGQPFPAVGQYADTNTNTVHTTRGTSRRSIAQDVGQLVGYNVLTPGDRHYFQRILGVGDAPWDNVHGAQNGAPVTGDETFANYYSVAATGGVRAGESLLLGETSIDARKLRQFTSAIGRLGRRNHLPALNLLEALASAK